LGDVGHPATFDFPVRRHVVQGASPARVVRGRDPMVLRPFLEAARMLVAEGADAIATSCGLLARWQHELQAAVPVPVWTSSLLTLADLAGTRCGVITIEAAFLGAAELSAAGADPATPVEGITAGSPLHRTLLEDLPTLDQDDAARQVQDAARRLLARHPDLQALVLECTNLPPYAPALRQATGLPVFDVTTMLNARMAVLAQGRT
jgi:Asp/Glu/hydantoin racemase